MAERANRQCCDRFHTSMMSRRLAHNKHFNMTKHHTNMTYISQNDDRLMRYGHPIYEVNPSLPNHLWLATSHSPSLSTKIDRNWMSGQEEIPVADNSFKTAELDSERFVKFYLDGIRQYAQLNQPGVNLFEFVYEQLSRQDAQNKDKICLNYVLANKWRLDLTRRSYSRGIAELLNKEFLFRSMVNDVYFINVRFVFNGDRVALVRSVRG
jgi:hypothetical protein